MRLTISWRQSRFTSPGKGEVGEHSEPGVGRDPHPTASRSTSPFQGEVKRVCSLACAGFWGGCAPFLLAAALGGCASYSPEPSPEPQRAAWEARNLYPQSYRSEILAYMRNYFDDPRNVRDAFVSEPELKPIGLGDRYISCLRYGLRNAPGGTPPGREHIVIFVGGKLDALRDAKDQCAGAAYTAFPELERLTR